MPEIALAKANKTQLLAKAAEMNLEVSTSATNAELIEAIKAGGGGDVIEVTRETPLISPVDEDHTPTNMAKTKPTEEEKADDKEAGYSSVTLTIGEQEGEPDQVALHCNGQCLLVPRGESVTIPRKYFEVLRNAKKTIFKVGTEKGEAALSEPKDVPRFNYVVESKNK
jgi:hypothetical protein